MRSNCVFGVSTHTKIDIHMMVVVVEAEEQLGLSWKEEK